MSESNRIEYKRELTEGLEKEVVAFLNYHDGGVIYLGVENNGEGIGMADPDAVQLAVKDRLKNNIQPSALGLFDVILEQRDGKHIVKIIIASGSEKPYHLRKFGMSEKGCFIRIGAACEPKTKNNRLVDGLVDWLAESQKRILMLIKENPRISKRQMADCIGISTTAIDKNIAALKDKGLLQRIGSDKAGYWALLEGTHE
ncbi:MAG: RNA-binding domain-containing protein [Burkholderiales bacterium]|jgi:predicted HTH transcriptional regulator